MDSSPKTKARFFGRTFHGTIATDVVRCACWGSFDCLACSGSGFRNTSLPIALALARAGVSCRPYARWSSRTDNCWAFAEHHGLNSSCAVLIDMRGYAGGTASNHLAQVAEEVHSEVFSLFDVPIQRVSWFYRNPDCGLDRVYFEQGNTDSYKYKELLHRWDGDAWNEDGLPAIHDELKGLLQDAIRRADEHPY